METQKQKAIVRAGRMARLRGVPREQNPYRFSQDAEPGATKCACWYRGWDEGDAEAKSRKEAVNG